MSRPDDARGAWACGHRARRAPSLRLAAGRSANTQAALGMAARGVRWSVVRMPQPDPAREVAAGIRRGHAREPEVAAATSSPSPLRADDHHDQVVSLARKETSQTAWPRIMQIWTR
jgi:hypothetical protein